MLNVIFRKEYKTIPFAMHINDGKFDTHLHNHSEFEIILITDGSSNISVGDKLYTLSKDDMIFINPFEIHSVIADKSIPYSHICICFDCDLIIDKKTAEKLKEENLFINHLIKSTTASAPILKLCFNAAVNSYCENQPCSDIEVVSYLSLIFSHLINYNLTREKVTLSKNTIFCTKALSYIAENFRSDISSKDAAAALSYNQSYFCRHFYKNFGTHFTDYLNNHRISFAKKQLEETELSITQIANLCGFESHSYFSKCFKSQLGISPSEYKKKFVLKDIKKSSLIKYNI